MSTPWTAQVSIELFGRVKYILSVVTWNWPSTIQSDKAVVFPEIDSVTVNGLTQ